MPTPVAQTLQIVTYRISEWSALLMCSPKSMQRTSSNAVGRKKIPTAEDEAESLAYRLDSGGLYMPASAFRKALVTVCSGKRIGKRAAGAIIKGAVFCADEMCPLLSVDLRKPITEYEIHNARCVIQNAAIIRSRPLVRRWSCVLRLEVETLDVSIDNLTTLLVEAGRTTGIGSYRPEKGGPFGRFKVALEQSSPLAA